MMYGTVAHYISVWHGSDEVIDFVTDLFEVCRCSKQACFDVQKYLQKRANQP